MRAGGRVAARGLVDHAALAVAGRALGAGAAGKSEVGGRHVKARGEERALAAALAAVDVRARGVAVEDHLRHMDHEISSCGGDSAGTPSEAGGRGNIRRAEIPCPEWGGRSSLHAALGAGDRLHALAAGLRDHDVNENRCGDVRGHLYTPSIDKTMS